MASGSLPTGGQVGVQLGLKLSPVEPERSDGVVQPDPCAGVGGGPGQHQSDVAQVFLKSPQLLEAAHTDDRGDRTASAGDNYVLPSLGVLNQAGYPTARCFGHGNHMRVEANKRHG